MRIQNWTLRCLAWVAVVFPLVRYALWPQRVWFDGRYAQLRVHGEDARAQASILKSFGLSARFPQLDFDFHLDGPFSGFLKLTGVRQVWLSLSHRTINAHGGATLYLTADAEPLLPPFWPGSLAPLIGLPNANGRLLLAGLEFEKSDGSTETGYCNQASGWRVWCHDGGRWYCALNVAVRSEKYFRLEFIPSAEQVERINYWTMAEFNSTEKLTATFKWHARDGQFTCAFLDDEDLRLPNPPPPITLDTPPLKFMVNYDEMNADLPPGDPEVDYEP